MTDKTPEGKTLQQCKDEIAQKNGWANWQELDENESMGTAAIMNDRAAELYARTRTLSALEECRKGTDDIICRYAVLGWPITPEGITQLRKEIQDTQYPIEKHV